MNKESFIRLMQSIQKIADSYNKQRQTLFSMGVALEGTAFDFMFDLALDCLAANYENAEDAITYFVYERDFGRTTIKQYVENFFDSEGNIVPLDTIEQLYDFIAG